MCTEYTKVLVVSNLCAFYPLLSAWCWPCEGSLFYDHWSSNRDKAFRKPGGHDTSRLTPDQDKPGAILMERLKADVVETETEYSGASQQKHYKLVADMLGPLLHSSGQVTLS